jgi:Domain of unknown function (DUF4349)
MTHPDDTTTIERDLRAVDAALAGGVATHDDPAARELQELALALRSDTAQPDPAFAEKLRERVDAGFPAEPGSTRARFQAAGASLRGLRGRWSRADFTFAGAAASVLLVVVTVAIVAGPGNGGMDDGGGGEAGDGGGAALESGGGGGATQAAPREAAPETSIAPTEDQATGGSTPPLPGTGFAPGRRQRRIERSIDMTLTAPADEIASVADGVNDVTARHGGFVLSSDLDTDDEGASGSFELRIPSNRLQAAVRDLSKLATVSSQSQSGRDVTREHVTAVDRLQAARAERRSLLRRLEQAATDEEAEAIRRRLDLVAGEINGLRAQLRDLRLRTDYAVVRVDLDSGEGDAKDGASGAFDDSLNDAGDLLVGFAGVLIRTLAIALPLALIGLVAWLTGRGLRRRRRESALA